MSPQEKLVEHLTEAIDAVAKLLKSAGFVKVRGRWVSADDLKADER